MSEAGSTIESILAWAKKLPAWQQDALRRLIVQGELSETDRAELVGMARRWAKLPAVGAPKEPCLLEACHFPSEGVGGTPLRLLSMRDLMGVNALAEGQTLSFGSFGLTVVFGTNGAGKSGYFRVLKHSCQARALEPILGDIRQPMTPSPSAVFDVVSDVDGESQRSMMWGGGTPCAELQQFSLFDSACGRQIVGTAADPVFLPVGLESFSPFASFLDDVRTLLEGDIKSLRDTQHLAVSANQVVHPKSGKL